jgi:hypothetical protein
MITKIERPHYKVEIYKPDLGEGLLAYAHKGTKESKRMVEKLIKKFKKVTFLPGR